MGRMGAVLFNLVTRGIVYAFVAMAFYSIGGEIAPLFLVWTSMLVGVVVGAIVLRSPLGRTRFA